MILRRLREPQREDATEAVVDGDVFFPRGTVQAALAHRDFRVVWGGTFASNIGTWMQNVLLGAFGYKLTHSATFVGLLYFGQLGPLLFLAALGGMLADVLDRRKLLLWTQVEQLVLSFLLAWFARGPHPAHAPIVLCVFAIGIGNALSGPALAAVLPTLVPPEDLPGAVSLQSVQMNLSRVIGPAVGAVIYSGVGAAAVFAINACTYLFAVMALLVVRFASPAVGLRGEAESFWARLGSGFRIAWADPLVRRILVTMTAFSFFCLAFIGLMPALASENLGIDPKHLAYGLLYASFGAGAAVGAVSVGTIFVRRSKATVVRIGLVAFAALLAAFGALRTAPVAYPVAFVLGFAYFSVVTSLSTVLQEHLEDEVRGRVMALWIMSFGGMVPLGTLAAGPLAQWSSITAVVVGGAVIAAGLALYADLRRVPGLESGAGAPDSSPETTAAAAARSADA